MPQFMLVLRDNPDGFAALSPEDMQKVIEKYKAWGDRLGKAGLLVGGDKLADGEGRVLRRNNGKVRVTDGPFTESREVLGGYYLLSCQSYDEAVTHASDCPHLDFGPIEIRAIDKV